MRKRSMGYILLAVLITISIVFTGCSSKNANEASPAEQSKADYAAPEAGAAPAAPSAPAVQAPNRKLIVRLYMEMRVENIEKSILDAEKLAAEASGYTRESYQNEASGQLTLMIPAEKVEAFTASLGGLGKVTSSNRKTEDVTDSYFDTGIRIKNLETELETMRGLLQKPGLKVSDILEVEREILRLTDELEILKGYLTNLDRQISYSEVQISFEKNRAAIDNANQDSLGYELMLSLKNGIDFVISIVTGILRFIVFILPVSPIIAIVYFIFRKPLSRFRSKGKEEPKQERLQDSKQE